MAIGYLKRAIFKDYIKGHLVKVHGSQQPQNAIKHIYLYKLSLHTFKALFSHLRRCSCPDMTIFPVALHLFAIISALNTSMRPRLEL